MGLNKNTNQSFNHPSFTGLIGIEQRDITPPRGIYARNWGAAEHDVSEGTHRPLVITCITFQVSKEETPLVLVSADLGWWKSQEDERHVRGGILKAMSLSPDQLMVCLSHTHSGPSIYREDASKQGGEYIKPYLDHIREQAIKVARKALSKASPATLTWHYGKCGLATNRDLADKNSNRYLTGFNPHETADDTLLVGRITNDQQQIIGTIVNYACHPTTLGWQNRLVSPDYIGAMRQVISDKTQAPCLFLQGASGNLAPAEQYVADTEVADSHGRQLGYAVLATLEDMLPPLTQLTFDRVVESGAPLAVWEQEDGKPRSSLLAKSVEVPLPLKPLPSLSELERTYAQCEDHVKRERLRRKIASRQAVGDGKVTATSFWMWILGESILIGQPNEAYSLFQMELRRRLPFRASGIINIANGYVGYLPPAHLYDEDIYTVWQTPFAKGALELLIERALKEAKSLMPKEDYG